MFEVNGKVGDIYVRGNYAFIATGRDDAEFMIINISNPASMTQAGLLNLEGTSDGTAVFATNTNVVLVGTGSKLYYIDVANPAAPALLGSADTGGTVNDIYVQENLAFLGTSDSNREFQVWDISNPASMSLWSSLNFPQVASGIDYEDNVVYVAVRSNDALRIITSQ